MATRTFDRVRDLQARFDLFTNSELGRSLKTYEGLNSSLVQSLKQNFPLSETVRQMGRLALPTIPQLNSPLIEALKRNSPFAETFKQMERLLAPSLRMQERINSPTMRMLARLDSPLKGLDNPAFAAICAARIWSDSFSEAHRAAQSSMQETLRVFQRAAEEAAAMARVDVAELATAVEASLGSLPLAATVVGSAAIVEGADTASATGYVTVPLTGARTAATSGAITPTAAADSRSLEDVWKTIPLPVLFFLYLLWHLLIKPLDNAYMEQWVKGAPDSRPQIINNVNQNLGEDYSRKLRFVRGSGINVRESPSKVAPIIGRLSRSQAVAVIETEGSFSRIQYHDAASGEIREGWAAAGYLVGTTC